MAPWVVDLSLVPRERLGHSLDLDAPVNAAHRARLEELGTLVDSDGEGMHPGEVLEVAAAWHRQVCAAQAALRSWCHVLSRTRAMAQGRSWEAAVDATAAELAMRLGVSVPVARGLVREGAALRGPLLDVAALAADGLLDAAKTSVLVGELAEVDLPVALAVLDQVLPDAPRITPAELRRRLQRALVQVDPDGDAGRAAHAHTGRRVEAVRPRGHGMASLTAVLPAGTAATLEKVCESAARAAHARGDERTLDQLRADALAAMAQQASLTGQIGLEGRTDDVFTFDPAKAKVRIIATKRAQAGLPETTVTAVDPYLWDLTRDAEDGEPSPYEDWVAPTSCRPGRDIPELVGYGALPPKVVVTLINKPWILVTEPPDLDHPPPPVATYRPSAELDRYVRTRDRTCQAPGCFVDAWRCDLDHITEWPQGETSADNLLTLCRYHHRLRTHEGHTYRVTSDRVVHWTTPLGQVFTRTLEGRISQGEHDDAPLSPEAIGDLADWHDDAHWSTAV